MSSSDAPLLIISGPTASGKSSLAIKLAKELGGEIISVDSAQVYKDFDIGTDKVSEGEKSEVPHHCIDFLDGHTQCNAFVWLQESEKHRKRILAEGKLPIFAGGTTLYVSAMVRGLDPLPPRNEELRQALDELHTSAIYAKALEIDVAKDIDPNDRVRLVRAIEVAIDAGSSNASSWPANPSSLMLVLCPEREQLYEKINSRVEQMLRSGLLEEARILFEKFGPDAPAFRSVGYAQCADFFVKRLEFERLGEEIAQASRRYAKRQLTFWRNEPRKHGWSLLPENLEISKENRRAKELVTKSYTFKDLALAVRNRLLEAIERPEVWYIRLGEGKS